MCCNLAHLVPILKSYVICILVIIANFPTMAYQSLSTPTPKPRAAGRRSALMSSLCFVYVNVST